MHIRGVDFPAELIEAHRAGELVIFAGAGVSMSPPSGLPSFATLVEKIANDAQVEMTDADWKHMDAFLGRLDQEKLGRKVDVHGLVAQHVTVLESVPNQLHFALADLAIAGGSVRIVTTNYDHHLTTALAQRGKQVEEFKAPALPVGDDFDGLVYVHGKLGDDPVRLVVTDKDFGRAYMTRAWATVFLERMFSAHTVLFVGYSMTDVVMGYLTRALRPGRVRYALTDSPDDSRWSSAEVTPIGYSVADGTHDALGVAIAEWAAQASAKLLDHRQRLAALLAAPPSLTPDDESYLEATLADIGRTRLFVDLARGPEWFTWLTSRPEFQPLFDPATPSSDGGWPLARWFADHFVADVAHAALALDVVHRAGGGLSRDLAMAVCAMVHAVDHPLPPHLNTWVALLVQYVPDAELEWLEDVFSKCCLPEERTGALLLLDRLSAPVIKTQPTFGIARASRFDVRPRSSRGLGQAWQSQFRPFLADIAHDVLLIIERHLRQARRLRVLMDGGSSGWDPVSFARSPIEPHEQDRQDDPFDPLIDAARDSVEALLAAGDGAMAARLDLWAADDVPILHRLAVHGWAVRADVDAADKVRWVCERGVLFHVQSRHEVFRLIRLALPDAGDDAASALVTRVLSESLDRRHPDYERFNLLAWITRHVPDLRIAQDALRELKQKHPEFEEQEHPDLLSWMSEFRIRAVDLPMTAEQLHENVYADPAAALAELGRFEDTQAEFDGPDWYDVAELLSGVVRDHPEDGGLLLAVPDGTSPRMLDTGLCGVGQRSRCW